MVEQYTDPSFQWRTWKTESQTLMHIVPRQQHLMLCHHVRVLSLGKSKIAVLNPKESENGFCGLFYWTDQSKIFVIMVYQRHRRIHPGSGLFGSSDAQWLEKSWINLSSKETQNLFSVSFGFTNPILDFLKKHTLSFNEPLPKLTIEKRGFLNLLTRAFECARASDR